MMKKNFEQSPFHLDSFHSRKTRVENLNRPDTVYARMWFSNFAVLIFVCIDLFCLKVVWNLVQTESPVFVYCLAFACAAALDIPLAIAAVTLKKYMQGLCGKQEKNIILAISVAVFVVAFAFSFGFRFITKDLSFDIGTSSTLTNTLASSQEDAQGSSIAVVFAALFNGIIPLLTSLSSFVLSFFSYDPIKIKLVKLEEEKIALQANILEAEKGLAQTEATDRHCAELVAREEDLFSQFINRLDADGAELKQLVRVILMEKLDSSESVTAMYRSGEKIAKGSTSSVTPGQELPKIILEGLKKEEKLVPMAKSNVA